MVSNFTNSYILAVLPRLQAPTTALGDFLRRPNHSVSSPNLTCESGVSPKTKINGFPPLFLKMRKF